MHTKDIACKQELPAEVAQTIPNDSVNQIELELQATKKKHTEIGMSLE